MEQINSGMLEMLKYVAASQKVPAKLMDAPKGMEGEFGKLLEKKNNEAPAENTSGKTETETGKTSEKDEVKEKEPAGEKDEKDVCDVAREVACGQIVWMTPRPDSIAVRTVEPIKGATMPGDLVTLPVEPDKVAVLSSELPVMQTEEIVMQETVDVVASGEEIASEQTAEIMAEMSGAQAETETGTQLMQENDFEVAETVDNAETDEAGEMVASETPLFKEVETAPIKVAEAPAQAEAPEVEKQVSDKLIQVLESGENRVEIQLNPEALGKVTIELTQNGDGTMSILLNAENAETRGMLERHITTLQETLMDRGQQSVQITVQRGEETQHQSYQQQDLRDGDGGQQGRQQQREQKNDSDDFLQQLRLGLVGRDETN